MRLNSFYIVVVVLGALLLYVTSKFYDGSGKFWVGMAEAKDFSITSEKQAMVKRVLVVGGQQVHIGDTLLVLESQALLQDEEKLHNRIALLQSEKMEKANLLKSNLDLLNANNTLEINGLTASIAQAEAELELNQKLSGTQNTAGTSPLEAKIKALKTEMELRHKEKDIKVHDLQVKHQTDQALIENQIKLLQYDGNILAREKLALVKIAAYDGVIEAVLVKAGEEVDAYDNLLSVYPKNPTSAIAYVQNEKNLPAIGTKVFVTGVDARWKTSEGKVIGYGAITSLPEILQKSTAVKAFGKQVFIEIPQNNTFSTGEKLLIRLWGN